jgi:tRNA(adenine34) deaminase
MAARDPSPGAFEAFDVAMMTQALELAREAAEMGEVPVGAVIVRDGQILAKAYNLRETLKDPTAHAERVALTLAAQALGDWRLEDCTLYVTLEPCVMCAGAIVLSRIERLVYGTSDPKAGACRSLYRLLDDPRLNHRVRQTAGVLAFESGLLLSHFFQEKRTTRKNDPRRGD